MLIEALAPLRVKADGKRFALGPGEVVDLSPGSAARLLERAAGKVRAIQDSLQVGMIVEWESPLFGLLRGTALEVTAHTVRVHHPLTEQEVPIPRTWLRVEGKNG